MWRPSIVELYNGRALILLVLYWKLTRITNSIGFLNNIFIAFLCVHVCQKADAYATFVHVFLFKAGTMESYVFINIK